MKVKRSMKTKTQAKTKTKSKSKDSLGDRMKGYENVSEGQLVRRTPVIVRVDGRSFSSFCRRFPKPYSGELHAALNSVMLLLCNNISGVKYASRHSDEISLLLSDFDTINTEAFFGYRIQKMVSVVAGMASSEFCKKMMQYGKVDVMDDEWPAFDARCFNVPERDVTNYFFWRLQDCLRNSVSMLAQSKFSHSQLQGKNNSEKQEMLFSQYGINWAKLPQEQKSGFACIKVPRITDGVEDPSGRKEWKLIPGPSTRLEVDNEIQKALAVANVADED